MADDSTRNRVWTLPNLLSLFILVGLVVASGLFSGAARPLREDEKIPATVKAD